MRGSPLIRFILLALGLAATAAGLARVTSSRPASGIPSNPPVVAPASADKISVPFHLILSDSAAEVVIDAATVLRPANDGGAISGTIGIDPGNPSLGLIVRWKNPAAAGQHRFAKLTLEAPGQPTFTHFFDADGDIDDFLELPFPAAK